MMDFNSILTFLRPELSLLAVIIILLLYDLCASEKGKKHFQTVAYVLFGAHTLWSFCLVPDGELFGGMFVDGFAGKSDTERGNVHRIAPGQQFS